MGDTVEFTTKQSRVNPGIGRQLINGNRGAWVQLLIGPIVGISKIEVNGDGKEYSNPISFEWIERPAAAVPDVTLTGHTLFAGESEPIGDLGASQAIWARGIDSRGGTMVVTSGG